MGRARHLRVVRHLNLHPRLPIAKEPTIRQENHPARRHARIRLVLRLQHQIVNHLHIEAIRSTIPIPPNEPETALRGVHRLRCRTTMLHLLLLRLGRTPIRQEDNPVLHPAQPRPFCLELYIAIHRGRKLVVLSIQGPAHELIAILHRLLDRPLIHHRAAFNLYLRTITAIRELTTVGFERHGVIGHASLLLPLRLQHDILRHRLREGVVLPIKRPTLEVEVVADRLRRLFHLRAFFHPLLQRLSPIGEASTLGIEGYPEFAQQGHFLLDRLIFHHNLYRLGAIPRLAHLHAVRARLEREGGNVRLGTLSGLILYRHRGATKRLASVRHHLNREVKLRILTAAQLDILGDIRIRNREGLYLRHVPFAAHHEGVSSLHQFILPHVPRLLCRRSARYHHLRIVESLPGYLICHAHRHATLHIRGEILLHRDAQIRIVIPHLNRTLTLLVPGLKCLHGVGAIQHLEGSHAVRIGLRGLSARQANRRAGKRIIARLHRHRQGVLHRLGGEPSLERYLARKIGRNIHPELSIHIPLSHREQRMPADAHVVKPRNACPIRRRLSTPIEVNHGILQQCSSLTLHRQRDAIGLHRHGEPHGGIRPIDEYLLLLRHVAALARRNLSLRTAIGQLELSLPLNRFLNVSTGHANINTIQHDAEFPIDRHHRKGAHRRLGLLIRLHRFQGHLQAGIAPRNPHLHRLRFKELLLRGRRPGFSRTLHRDSILPILKIGHRSNPIDVGANTRTAVYRHHGILNQALRLLIAHNHRQAVFLRYHGLLLQGHLDRRRL